ncbi:MAG: undecaprenyldiphospho-muramoylpentapeptide beta-N-acetylglucosaminyltransferase [Bacteroidia bacterium]|nr:undecaprenyldiphospho-muramoylpentapeptide beta-N-acetylglucosaminyltransferase [Bacteroidia bacterium]
MLNRVIISGGGTGGHIFPAIAIANEIKSRNPQAEILFIGALGRMEMEKVPMAGFKIIGLPIAGIQRRLSMSNFLVPFKLLKSLILSRKIVKDFKPQVVIGVGGYASAAVLYVASGTGIPCVIQEQNSYAGLTNKILGKRVAKVCVAYEGMEKFFPKSKIVLTGNPVRAEIKNAQSRAKSEAKASLGFDTNQIVVLVIGGSLGARTINQSIQEGIEIFNENAIQLLWQTGKNFKADTKGYQTIKASEFIYDMQTAYAAADLVVSRAGAISVSELCLLKKPCILVPSPNVAEDHQTKNALALTDKGAAILVKDLEAKVKLVNKVVEIAKNNEQLEALSIKIGLLAKPDALETIVNTIEAVL